MQLTTQDGARLHSFLGTTAVIRSLPTRQVLSMVQKTAKNNAAVLVTGETGSSKEVVAQASHHYSLRCTRPWIGINRAAFPDHLLESELFGYDKGALSGAGAEQLLAVAGRRMYRAKQGARVARPAVASFDAHAFVAVQ